VLALALACAAAAALRFATLDAQSLWYDESVTAQLMASQLGGMFHALPDSESTPPLYYVLAWLWTQLFGTGEAGLRSLSALLGTATVPIVWALGRRLGGDRAALIAAALAAVNPMLVWFSQEARSYALLTLLGALSALLWLRALEQPRSGRLVAWGAVAALALGTHYFAVFLVAPQALWLALRVPGPRAKTIALALPAAAGAALVPLALDQRSNEGAAFIGQSSLATRLAQIPKQFLIGYDAPAEALITILAAVAMLTAVAGLVLAQRRRAAPLREHETGDCCEHRDGCENRDQRFRGSVVADQELLGNLREARRQRALADERGALVRALVERQRHERRASRSRERERDRLGARPRHAQRQPQRLRCDQEDGEVVRAERERGDGAPGHQPAAAGLFERAQPQQRRQRAEQRQQRVRAGLLAEPHEHRVHRGERRGDQRRAVAAEPAPERPHDRDRRRAQQCRQRAQPRLAGPEQLRPQPGEDVVQRRGRLAVGQRVKHAAQLRRHELRRDRLVVPEALGVERRESQRRGRGAGERQREHEAPATCTTGH